MPGSAKLPGIKTGMEIIEPAPIFLLITAVPVSFRPGFRDHPDHPYAPAASAHGGVGFERYDERFVAPDDPASEADLFIPVE